MKNVPERIYLNIGDGVPNVKARRHTDRDRYSNYGVKEALC